MRITEIHHRDGSRTTFESPRGAASTAAIGAVLSVLLGLAACGAALLNGCGGLDGACSCKCKEPYVQACPVSGPGTCGCVMPYHKPVSTPDGGSDG